MSEFTLQISESTPCANCASLVPLKAQVCPKCGTRAAYRLTFEEFFGEIEQRRITDAKLGGLVVGRQTIDDDIPLYQHTTGNVFAVVGLMQGGEYLLSQAASRIHKTRLEAINSEKGSASAVFPIKLTSFTSVINTNIMPPFGGLWIDWHQFVVNRFATEKYYQELEELNADTSFS